MKTADQVFAPGKVDPGLATHGAVHHAQKRCGDHQKRQSPKVGRGDKPGQVARDASPQSNQQGFSIGLQIQQFFVK